MEQVEQLATEVEVRRKDVNHIIGNMPKIMNYMLEVKDYIEEGAIVEIVSNNKLSYITKVLANSNDIDFEFIRIISFENSPISKTEYIKELLDRPDSVLEEFIIFEDSMKTINKVKEFGMDYVYIKHGYNELVEDTTSMIIN